ncbi:hypothetical protein HAPG_00107 [Halorubrum phage GNf2]|nr:hypothetical protein HAPG_00107 [Halorubrum phage GNf2]
MTILKSEHYGYTYKQKVGTLVFVGQLASFLVFSITIPAPWGAPNYISIKERMREEVRIVGPLRGPTLVSAVLITPAVNLHDVDVHTAHRGGVRKGHDTPDLLRIGDVVVPIGVVACVVGGVAIRTQVALKRHVNLAGATNGLGARVLVVQVQVLGLKDVNVLTVEVVPILRIFESHVSKATNRFWKAQNASTVYESFLLANNVDANVEWIRTDGEVCMSLKRHGRRQRLVHHLAGGIVLNLKVVVVLLVGGNVRVVLLRLCEVRNLVGTVVHIGGPSGNTHASHVLDKVVDTETHGLLGIKVRTRLKAKILFAGLELAELCTLESLHCSGELGDACGVLEETGDVWLALDLRDGLKTSTILCKGTLSGSSLNCFNSTNTATSSSASSSLS